MNNKIKILYPCDYFDTKKVDPDFEYERKILSKSFSTGVIGKNDFEKGDSIIYRGWMLNSQDYNDIEKALNKKHCELLIPFREYESNHYFEGWYSPVKSHTIESVVLTSKEEILKELSHLQWGTYFVKDAVKSLTTSKKSIAKTEQEIKEILNEIEKYRGVERYFVLRRSIDLLEETERRYFAIKGIAFSSSPDEAIPDKVKEIANILKERTFISIDMCMDKEGNEWLIEIGDGQVSDLKEWKPEIFINVIKEIERHL